MTGKTKTKLQHADVTAAKVSRAREPNRADTAPTLQRKPAPARDARLLRAEGGHMASSSPRQGSVARARQMRRLQRSAGNMRVNGLVGMPLKAQQAVLEKQSSQQTSWGVESSVQQTHPGVAPWRPVAQRKPSERDNGPPVQLQGQEMQEEEELQVQAEPRMLQRQPLEDEEELLQGKMGPVQRQEGMEELEEEELLQGQFDPVQRQGLEDAEAVQGKFDPGQAPTQLKGELGRRENRTGMPDNLKAGIENLSGMSMDYVKVHYNSSKPAQLNALAYTQGRDIEVGPGQERHLAHEGWHAVQQMQGRVKPTMQAKGVEINDDAGLEHEADVMGAKALQMHRGDNGATGPTAQAAPTEQREVEPTEASEVPGAAIGASGEKGRLNFLSIYNSSKPATVQAHAYAQGSNIHLAPGQEKHLPHELGHVVQQVQGRVKPTKSVGGMPVNDDASLEKEATQMGVKALQRKSDVSKVEQIRNDTTLQSRTIQRQTAVEQVAGMFPGEWTTGGNDKGIGSSFQDLGSQLGINLKRVHKGINGRHVAVEYGFGDSFQSTKHSNNIVDNKRGETIKFKASAKSLTATVDQISIHKAGAHARIVVSGIKGI